MKHIYLIDYYNPLKNNGLNSYVTQLTDLLKGKEELSLHIIWSRTTFVANIKAEIIENIEHIYVPYDLVSGSKIKEQDLKVVLFLEEKIKRQKNVIFHFNSYAFQKERC